MLIFILFNCILCIYLFTRNGQKTLTYAAKQRKRKKGEENREKRNNSNIKQCKKQKRSENKYHLEKSTLDNLFLKIGREIEDLTSNGSEFHNLIERLKKLLHQIEFL